MLSEFPSNRVSKESSTPTPDFSLSYNLDFNMDNYLSLDLRSINQEIEWNLLKEDIKSKNSTLIRIRMVTRKICNIYDYRGHWASRECSVSNVKNLWRLVPISLAINKRVVKPGKNINSYYTLAIIRKDDLQKFDECSYGLLGPYTYIFINLSFCQIMNLSSCKKGSKVASNICKLTCQSRFELWFKGALLSPSEGASNRRNIVLKVIKI